MRGRPMVEVTVRPMAVEMPRVAVVTASLLSRSRHLPRSLQSRIRPTLSQIRQSLIHSLPSRIQ